MAGERRKPESTATSSHPDFFFFFFGTNHDRSRQVHYYGLSRKIEIQNIAVHTNTSQKYTQNNIQYSTNTKLELFRRNISKFTCLLTLVDRYTNFGAYA
jgi:hypothetical protein